MATDQDFVEYVRSQSGLGRDLTYRKMFGEYALYLEEKVVAFACDNQLYVKPTPAGKGLLAKVAEHPPYRGAKLHFRIDDELEDRELLRQLLQVTARALPPARPKAKAEDRRAP